ncbi:MAG TPA: hypothetical protein VGS96_09860 [Thermoanaerobaculia bacterium]|jgi:hypothetical protein|nr:hypothetical protein [Thermoanaerobaculia bacterium]
MNLHVFVAAAWACAPRVRALHGALRAAGCVPRSHWADESDGSEAMEFSDLSSDEDIDVAWRANREGICESHVVIVLADTPTREGHAEAEYARMMGKSILWVGKPTLTSRRFKYETFHSDLEAVEFVSRYVVDQYVRNYIDRGHLVGEMKLAFDEAD